MFIPPFACQNCTAGNYFFGDVGPAWLRTYGGTGTQSSSAMVVDAFGNTYVAGFFITSATLNTTVLTQGGLFLAKFDVQGGNNTYAATSVAVDSNGDVYIAGSFIGNFTLGRLLEYQQRTRSLPSTLVQ